MTTRWWLDSVRALLGGWQTIPAAHTVGILSLDALATYCGLHSALLLRLSGDVPPVFAREARTAVPVLVFIRLAAVLAARLHRWSFRGSGLSEAARLGVATLGASVVFAFACGTLPRTVYPLEFFCTLTLMAGYRFAPRFVESWYADWRRRGSCLGGKRVLGDLSQLPEFIARHRVSTLLLAITRFPAERVHDILKTCASLRASVKTVPTSYALLDQRSPTAMLRDFSPEDLLPRDPVTFGADEIRRLVRARRALVTGAGGTIGGEICRQLARHGIAELVMLDLNENEIYLARRLQEEHPQVRVCAEVANIRDLARLQRLGEQFRPEFVFHAAAHKHVPLMETAPEEAVKNNVFGTLNVALMAHGVRAEQLVVVSTDKAVNPSSVMGATKRVAELVVQDFARRSETKMTAVRFGNVLDSAGSVLPLFKQRIERDGAVTVTHPDCTRYFMTVSEAVGLVLLAGLGGYGELCVLDMGEPTEIASNLITRAGRIPGQEIPSIYTGLRPGEKLCEEILTKEEEQTMQARDRIKVARCSPPPADLARRLQELKSLAEEGDRAGILAAIEALVPTYCRPPRSDGTLL